MNRRHGQVVAIANSPAAAAMIWSTGSLGAGQDVALPAESICRVLPLPPCIIDWMPPASTRMSIDDRSPIPSVNIRMRLPHPDGCDSCADHWQYTTVRLDDA